MFIGFLFLFVNYLENATTKTHSFKHLMEAKSSYKALKVLLEAPRERPITTECTMMPNSNTCNHPCLYISVQNL
jgi:hypothetical protein